MKLSKFLTILIIILTLSTSCSHTNLLKDYDLRETSIYLGYKVYPDAKEVNIIDNSNHNNQDTSGMKSVLNTITKIAAEIGGSLIAQDLNNKLNNAVNTDSLMGNITNDFKNNLIKLLKIKPLANIYDEYDYFITFELEKCNIIITSEDIFLNLSVITSITHQNTATIVWEYKTECNKPFKTLNISSDASSSFLKNISQAYNIYNLSEADIRNSVNIAAFEISKKIYETFRKDYQKSLKDLNSR